MQEAVGKDVVINNLAREVADTFVNTVLTNLSIYCTEDILKS